jgi:hypothetical protein
MTFTLPKLRRFLSLHGPAAFLWFACAVPSVSLAQVVPEKLVYELSWGGFQVGTATQEITESGAERRIVSTARSNAWLSVFYPVEDRIESHLLRKEGLFPGATLRYRMQMREGGRRRDREILFAPAQGEAHYFDHLTGERAAVTIPHWTYDIYASFYYIRYLDLQVGRSVFVDVLDGKEVRHIEVQVLRKEKLRTMLGELTTLVVRPLVRAEGVFEGKGGVIIWFTDDARRIPVRAETKVSVGSVVATLRERIE